MSKNFDIFSKFRAFRLKQKKHTQRGPSFWCKERSQARFKTFKSIYEYWPAWKLVLLKTIFHTQLFGEIHPLTRMTIHWRICRIYSPFLFSGQVFVCVIFVFSVLTLKIVLLNIFFLEILFPVQNIYSQIKPGLFVICELGQISFCFTLNNTCYYSPFLPLERCWFISIIQFSLFYRPPAKSPGTLGETSPGTDPRRGGTSLGASLPMASPNLPRTSLRRGGSTEQEWVLVRWGVL